jgi:hypothetical protein
MDQFKDPQNGGQQILRYGYFLQYFVFATLSSFLFLHWYYLLLGSGVFTVEDE